MTVARTLKARNISWIWAVLIANAFVLLSFGYPVILDSLQFTRRSILNAILLGVAPVVVKLLSSLFPANVKATIVFWRLHHALPGHRAFSQYARQDPRVDVGVLRKKVGKFPTSPKDQNILWYGLFKKVDMEVAVSEAHQHYLLFRDIAAISLLLSAIAPSALILLGAERLTAGFAAGLFLAQYIGSAFAARNHGVALICNVLALYTVSQRSGPAI